MSCGARLPIYVLFTGAFFAGENAGSKLVKAEQLGITVIDEQKMIQMLS